MKEKKIKKLLIISLIVLAAAAVIAAAVLTTLHLQWTRNEFSLELALNGPEEITIEYGGTYEEPGATATFSGTEYPETPVDVAVTVEGTVDVNKVGTYYVDYSAKHTDRYAMRDVVMTDYARRTIHVVDSEAPVITLVADPDVYTIPGQVYQEEGFTATDNYDGDITHLVVRTETVEAVTYQVTDSSSNTTQVERVIVYHDPIPPELTLKGNATVTLEVGTAYKEPGYIATDNCDGDITSWVTVSGNVNVNKAGTYTLEYSVKDSYKLLKKAFVNISSKT